MNKPFVYSHLPWDEELLCDLQDAARDGLSLSQIADKLRKGARECDMALWALVGRSLDEAAMVLGRRSAA